MLIFKHISISLRNILWEQFVFFFRNEGHLNEGMDKTYRKNKLLTLFFLFFENSHFQINFSVAKSCFFSNYLSIFLNESHLKRGKKLQDKQIFGSFFCLTPPHNHEKVTML